MQKLRDDTRLPITVDPEGKSVGIPLIDFFGGAYILYELFKRGYGGEYLKQNPWKWGLFLTIPVGYFFHVITGTRTQLRDYIENFHCLTCP